MKCQIRRSRKLVHLLMRRALGVVAVVMAALALLGLLGMRDDVDDEVAAARRLAELMAVLGQGPQLTDEALLQALHRLDGLHRLRHLTLELRDSRGVSLLNTGTVEPPRLLQSVLGWLNPGKTHRVVWALQRPDGQTWQVQLQSSPGGEQSEALANLSGVFGLMLASCACLLLSLRWNLRRALAPLDRLVSAIGNLGTHTENALADLPDMPVSELEAIAQALRHLEKALRESQSLTRELSHKILSLQEEERSRVAHELHDEMGQRLTAMRVDTSRLLRELPSDTPVRAGVLRLSQHCEQLQWEVRQILAGLQPFGPAIQAHEPVSLDRLRRSLTELVASWQREGETQTPRVSLQWVSHPTGAASSTTSAISATWPLPRGLALTLYRITQEALTNVARHAHAQHAEVVLHVQLDELGRAHRLNWSVQDDGLGMSPPAQGLWQGNGLAGITQRVFAAGGDLKVQAARPGHAQPGVRLSASLSVDSFSFATHQR